MSDRLKTALVGAGRWGRNVAQALQASSELASYAASPGGAPNPWFAEHIPAARHASLDEIAGDSTLQAVAIATPIATHASIVRTMLDAGKHVVVEKPLAMVADEAQQLSELAKARGLVLVTGYQFLFHPVYEALRRRLDTQRIRRVTLTWRKYGTFREPIEWNLLTHHLAIGLDLLGVPSRGTLERLGQVESACDAIETTLVYPNAEVVSLIDRGSRVTSHTMSFDLDDGSAYVWSGDQLLHVEETEAEAAVVFESRDLPLTIEIARFVEAAAGGKATLPSAGDFGVRVLRVQEMLRPIK